MPPFFKNIAMERGPKRKRPRKDAVEVQSNVSNGDDDMAPTGTKALLRQLQAKSFVVL